jgi:hypothetical protein
VSSGIVIVFAAKSDGGRTYGGERKKEKYRYCRRIRCRLRKGVKQGTKRAREKEKERTRGRTGRRGRGFTSSLSLREGRKGTSERERERLESRVGGSRERRKEERKDGTWEVGQMEDDSHGVQARIIGYPREMLPQELRISETLHLIKCLTSA